MGLSPENWAAVKAVVQEINQRSRRRYAEERALLYRLSQERTSATNLGYMTKGEAANIARGVVTGEILDSDDLYGGVMVRAGYLFISEVKLEAGLREHGSNLTLNDPLPA